MNLTNLQNGEETKHVRRMRYSGTHPKNYKEKYKELNPEKYAKDVEHIIESGKTPAGMHIPICVDEILNFLQIKPGQIGLDATLGYGGHAKRMLECLQGKGHLYAIDVDHVEMEKTKNRLETLGYDKNILTIQQTNFSNIDTLLPLSKKFDFVLADLGLSSMQIDNPERGFSYKTDGPLDLRLNTEQNMTASKRLKKISKEELEILLTENADEPYAKEIALAITNATRSGIEIATTKQLTHIIMTALKFLTQDEQKKSCQRTFQAIRIDINKEYVVLFEFLDKLPNVLNTGGRVAILTFHSGEDRLVKKAFKYFFNQGIYSEIAKDVILPSASECFSNPRAHSAKLRWAIKA